MWPRPQGCGQQLPAGSDDISGPDTTSYRELLADYARLSGNWQFEVPVGGMPTGVVSMVSAVVLPVPGALTANLTASLDFPMTASGDGLRKLVPDPDGGLLGVKDSILRALAMHPRHPVNKLADSHHLADTDPDWAGGDTARIRQLTPWIARPALAMLRPLPGPARAAVRTGLDALADLTAKVAPL